MNTATTVFVGVLIAYVVGSLPFGLIVTRLVRRVDIRSAGSGNIGATNVARVLGAKWGILVLALDGLKGALPVLLIPRIFGASHGDINPHLQVACGIATVTGHMFPCWLKFRGGKGVATAFGVTSVLAPWATLAAFAVFAINFGLTRIVSLGSMLAAITFAACQVVLLLPHPFSAGNWSLASFSLLVPALIVLRHQTNLRRLLKGGEEKFRAGDLVRSNEKETDTGDKGAQPTGNEN